MISYDFGSDCIDPGHCWCADWGSIGIFGFDLVAYLCGGQLSALSRVIFTVVGLAGLWCVTLLFRERSEIARHE